MAAAAVGFRDRPTVALVGQGVLCRPLEASAAEGGQPTCSWRRSTKPIGHPWRVRPHHHPRPGGRRGDLPGSLHEAAAWRPGRADAGQPACLVATRGQQPGHQSRSAQPGRRAQAFGARLLRDRRLGRGGRAQARGRAGDLRGPRAAPCDGSQGAPDGCVGAQRGREASAWGARTGRRARCSAAHATSCAWPWSPPEAPSEAASEADNGRVAGSTKRHFIGRQAEVARLRAALDVAARANPVWSSSRARPASASRASSTRWRARPRGGLAAHRRRVSRAAGRPGRLPAVRRGPPIARRAGPCRRVRPLVWPARELIGRLLPELAIDAVAPVPEGDGTNGGEGVTSTAPASSSRC